MSEETELKSTIIGPLNFAHDPPADIEPANLLTKKVIDIQCLLCDEMYTFYAKKDDYLAHLYLEHRLIIGDEDQVAIFDEYLIYWRQIFNGDVDKLNEFCTTMIMDQLPDGTPSKDEKYYLLCDVLPQDNELRRNLYTKRLEAVLTQHQHERIDTTFERNCLYCRDVIQPTRADFLEHLFSKHFLQLGKSENLVFVDELIETVQEKMNNLICLFCEKQFKDRPTLKEHMRKKGHKRINPDNKNYDKFFLVNYKNEKQSSYGQRTKQRIKHRTRTKSQQFQEKVKPYQSKNTANAGELSGAAVNANTNRPDSTVFETNNSDSDWSDWEGDKPVLTCLFCARNDTNFTELKTHMIAQHQIDFDKETIGLTFYDRVKIVNFIRRQMHILRCVKCDENFKTSGELQLHLKDDKHYDIGARKQWDLPEYFFPTYEDDAFLCSLDDTNDTDFDDDNTLANTTKITDASVVVHSEDPKICLNADAEALSKEHLLDF